MSDIRVLPADGWASAVAAALIAQLHEQPALRLCLPTGVTPAPLYAELAAAAQRGEVSLAGATIVLLDEWVGLAPDDPARCDVALRRALLDHLPEPPRAFHSIRVDDLPPADAAAEHDRLAAQGMDLALVGLGGNGHVGFNEPGSTADSATRVVELAQETIAGATARYGARSRPAAGVTLGLARLLEATELWLLVTGAHKAGVLRAALDGPEAPGVPASYLRRHPRLVVWADEPAAGEAGEPG
jgi:glucosamine-6-phosphate deaminase